MQIASDIHENWRKTSGYSVRIKPVTEDSAWILEKGVWCDIQNTIFGELPSDWKKVNYQMALLAIDTVCEEQDIEAASAMLHKKWLDCNPKKEETKKDTKERDKKEEASASYNKNDIKNMRYTELPEELRAKPAFLARTTLETISEDDEKEQYEVVYNHIYSGVLNIDPSGGLFFSGLEKEREKKCRDIIEIAKKAIEVHKQKQ
ncbi:hypothetical protein LPJ64_000386 [Coemansia asiatica]|uniref:Uncharacterized protein n=1 Tax=Coemansia asiatica TaxID=1052880 RepID=A0A9W7XR11_9FUNG|nr:hypothetical protein LPJ64_000386 [Coemansia asiatica]